MLVLEVTEENVWFGPRIQGPGAPKMKPFIAMNLKWINTLHLGDWGGRFDGGDEPKYLLTWKRASHPRPRDKELPGHFEESAGFGVRFVQPGLYLDTGLTTRSGDIELVWCDIEWCSFCKFLLRRTAPQRLMRLWRGVGRTVPKLLRLMHRAAEKAYAPGGQGFAEVAATTSVGRSESREPSLSPEVNVITFVPGTTVTLKGLSRVELNGMTGTILPPSTAAEAETLRDKRRVKLRVNGGAASMAIKMENIQVAEQKTVVRTVVT